MLKALPGFLLLPLSIVFFVIHTLFWCALIYLVLIFKLLSPTKGLRQWWTRRMATLGSGWVTTNTLYFDFIMGTKIHLDNLPDVSMQKSYLVISNHQSWLDILILQYVFNWKIPFLRFFLKQQLLYMPVIGGVWWALDYPFMKRYSKEYLAKHPEKRGKDLETTREACEKFKGSPISIINFLEGTRRTASKAKDSEYRHLLGPKAGGIAFVLQSMGEQFDSILDVTISYEGDVPSMVDMFKGKFRQARVHVMERKIPAEFIGGDYMEDPAFRDRFQAWIREIWRMKDDLLEDWQSSHENK